MCKASSGPNCIQSSDRSEYVYDDDGHLIGEYPANVAEHSEILWLDDTPVALLKRRNGSTDGGPTGGGSASPWSGTPAGGVDVYYIHPDHLDTPRVIVNAANQPIWRWDSAPFGDTDANEQPSGGLPSFTFNLRFPGQQYDRETGTHYNYFRDYEAGSGRYVQSDPLGVIGSLATFDYVLSSPIKWSDRFGLKVSDAAVKKCQCRRDGARAELGSGAGFVTVAVGVDAEGVFKTSCNGRFDNRLRDWAERNELEVLEGIPGDHAEDVILPHVEHFEVSRPVCSDCEKDAKEMGRTTTTAMSGKPSRKPKRNKCGC